VGNPVRKFLAIGIFLVLLGSFIIASAGHSGEMCKPQYTKMKLGFARVMNIQNGDEVGAYVLAVDVPINASRIKVVNNPSGVSYIFKKRNGLFYPPKSLFFDSLYVKNLSWKAHITVYAISGNYVGFLNVSDGRFKVTSSSIKNFGGIAFPCNHPFVFNVSDPKGTVYGDYSKVLLVLKNDSLTILNERYHGTPLSLQMGCGPDLSKIGYTLLYKTPSGGYIFHSGVLDESIVILGRGFSFKELNARQNITSGCPKSPRKKMFLTGKALSGTLLIFTGLLLIMRDIEKTL
jgi:hypothetical protein